MNEDKDIKIAGEKYSFAEQLEAETKASLDVFTHQKDKGNIEKAKQLGRFVAEAFLHEKNELPLDTDEGASPEMIAQRQQLLAFTATVSFETFCANVFVSKIALSEFNNVLQKNDPELYRASTDTGAFSFYYLAFRRGGDIERRIGQTFAMLCLHDGDPIYQELGEALYCWFTSYIEKKVRALGLDISS